MRERRITHLHAHFASVSAAVARVAARLAGIGYSVTAHAKDIFHAEVDHDRLRERIADARAVITVSDFNLDHLRRTFGADADRVGRIYNGIDLGRFPYTSPADRPVAAAPPVIAAVGRLVEKKGFADLIDAAALLRDAGREFRIELAGTGPLAEELAEQVRRHRLDDRVRLLGALPQTEVARMVGGAAAFAAPCVVGDDGNRDGLPDRGAGGDGAGHAGGRDRGHRVAGDHRRRPDRAVGHGARPGRRWPPPWPGCSTTPISGPAWPRPRGT